MVNYLDFYLSAREYLIKIKKVSEQDFDCVKESEITKIENLIEKKFPPSLFEYLRIFGKLGQIIPEGFPINLARIEDAYYKTAYKISILESRDFKVYTDGKKITNGKVIQTDDSHESEYFKKYNILDLLNVKDFLFLDINDTATFINSKEEDPIVHYLIDSTTLTSSMLPLSTSFRAILFNEILPKLGWNPNYYKDRDGRLKKDLSSFDRERFWLKDSIDISNLEWALIYDKIFREEQQNISVFQEIRREFYQINEINEKQNGRILTIDEFEWQFIKNLKDYGFNI